jgi:hypothetical protein
VASRAPFYRELSKLALRLLSILQFENGPLKEMRQFMVKARLQTLAAQKLVIQTIRKHHVYIICHKEKKILIGILVVQKST